mmetsp:Transcript_2562/g.8734  ORF Transcript_2562/g.8734 Transcript_2562/m.8734 type:complete len:231 (+) Transcript_2562:3668-4360(+)
MSQKRMRALGILPWKRRTLRITARRLNKKRRAWMLIRVRIMRRKRRVLRKRKVTQPWSSPSANPLQLTWCQMARRTRKERLSSMAMMLSTSCSDCTTSCMRGWPLLRSVPRAERISGIQIRRRASPRRPPRRSKQQVPRRSRRSICSCCTGLSMAPPKILSTKTSAGTSWVPKLTFCSPWTSSFTSLSSRFKASSRMTCFSSSRPYTTMRGKETITYSMTLCTMPTVWFC